MPNGGRIVFVSELFYPEESATAHILTKIAAGLTQEFELLVLTGPASYEGNVLSNSAEPPIGENRIVRTWAPKLSKNKLMERLARFLVLTVSLSWKTLWKSRRTDLVFAVTNPALLVVALATIKKIIRFRLVFLVHDVFPENAVASGIIQRNNVLYSLTKRVFDWAYSSADALITIGRDMSEVIAQKANVGTERIVVIENWAEHPLLERIPRDQSLIVSMGLLDRIVIQYAGNIGRAQCLLEFVDLISTVQNDFICYIFRGSGAMTTALRQATRGHSRFVIEGPFRRSEQFRVLGACDIALVILGPEMYGLGVPSKTYNILASGKPILFLGPKNSEIYRLVKEHNIGWAFDWNEGDKLSELMGKWSINDLKLFEERGNNARRLAETFFTEAQQLAKFGLFFKNMMQRTDA